MNRFKFIPYAAGVCLLLVSLMGAIRLTKGEQPAEGAGGKAAPVATDGLVAKGTVVAEFDVLPYLLPAHLPSGRVRDILVKNGQTVKKGDVLVRFDDWELQAKLKIAEATVQAAIREQQYANGLQTQYAEILAKVNLASKTATEMRDKTKELLAAVRKKLKEQLSLSVKTDLDVLVAAEPELLRVEMMLVTAESAIKEKNIDLTSTNPERLREKAEAAYWIVQKAQADYDYVKQAIAQCEVKADIGGVIERVSATPGQIIYPQSRTPLFYLIPEGTRLVKAEVVPEFAFKIRDKDGSKVVISDDSNPLLTYEGTVEQTGTAFLPKTSGVDLITGKPSNVLEVQIRVSDPIPAGKPMLRVGQPVRVTFP